jgi:hypothetical protein
MNAAVAHQFLPTATSSIARPRLDAVSGAPRALLRLEAGVALAGSVVAYSMLGGHWGTFALLFLLPDLSLLGYLVGRRVGAACYNAAHSYLGPAALAALGASSGTHALLWLSSIWAAHVGFDRMLGYGLKYGTAFGDTHLGRVGRVAES